MFWNLFKKDDIRKEYIKAKIEQIEAEKKATMIKKINLDAHASLDQKLRKERSIFISK